MHGSPDLPLTSADLAGLPDFRLRELEISPATRCISGPSATLQVEPRVMQLLVALAEAPGRVLTREHLVQRCWGGVFVAEDSLNRAVSELRRALRSAGLAADVVETIPRTGYRLAVAVEAARPPATPTADGGQPPAPLARRALLATAVAAGIGAAGFLLHRRFTPDPLAKRAAELAAESELALRTGLPEDDAHGLALLEQAARLQPEDAALWGRLALARARTGEHAGPAAEVFPVVAIQDAARRARAIDPDNVDAQAAEAIAIPYYGDWLAAELRFDQVLARDSRHLAMRDSRAFLQGAVGRMREQATARLAFSARAPFDAPIQSRLIFAHWFLGDIAGADQVAARSTEMWPRHPYIWTLRFFLLAGTGRLERAIARIEDRESRPDLPPPMLAALGSAVKAAASGSPAAIASAVEQIMVPVSKNPGAVVNALMMLNLMGAMDQAFALSDAYFLERGPLIAALQWHDRPTGLDQRRRKTNMLFTPLAREMRRDPRFAILTRDMGLERYWQQRGVGPDPA